MATNEFVSNLALPHDSYARGGRESETASATCQPAGTAAHGRALVGSVPDLSLQDRRCTYPAIARAKPVHRIRASSVGVALAGIERAYVGSSGAEG